jgi:hypothetical protein
MLHSRFEWASATFRPHARGGRTHGEVLEEQAACSGTAPLYQVDLGFGIWCFGFAEMSCVCVGWCGRINMLCVYGWARMCACVCRERLCVYVCLCACDLYFWCVLPKRCLKAGRAGCMRLCLSVTASTCVLVGAVVRIYPWKVQS